MLLLRRETPDPFLLMVVGYVESLYMNLFLTFTVTRILRLIEKKMDGPDNYVICGSQSDSRAAIRVDTSKEA